MGPDVATGGEGFWRARRALVTGATGIVGSWLVKELLRSGAYVVALVLDADPQSELFRSGDVRRVSIVNGALEDLGALEDTLVVWGGEFGRTPMSQGGSGRDHHIKGFSYMLAGGGIKGGITYGATDELGYAAVENPVSVHDLHATMLHLLGINHLRMTVKFQGLNARLTNVSGEVVTKILA